MCITPVMVKTISSCFVVQKINCKSVCLSNREEICTYSEKYDALVITFTPCCWNYLQECIHHVSSYYTCQHVCIRNVLCHIHTYRIDRGNNVAGIQRRRGRGLAGDSSSRSSQRRGAEPWRASGVPWSPPHVLSKRQALEHSKSPNTLQMIT